MFFTSYEFVGFIFVLFFVYYIIPKSYQWILLLVSSYTFYYIAEPSFLIYILTTTLTTYFTACKIEKNVNQQNLYIQENKSVLLKEEKKLYKNKQKKIRFRMLISCLAINLGILVAVKYTNFFISNVNGMMSVLKINRHISMIKLALPMGISFYTFQAVGYLIDVYRGSIHAEKNLFKFALFISFFPQLVQGPISRFGDLSNSLYEKHSFDSKNVCYGLQRILWGYFKKIVIADRILTGVTVIIRDSNTYKGAYAFVGMIFYTLQLYADFTGGIDITIGVAQTLGIAVKENFNRPYFSKSLKEYWRRWHISMSTWFKDYVFYPFSICKPMQRFSKLCRKNLGNSIGKRLPVYLSTFMVWFLTGLWHGASWNFIVWGLSNAVVLLISEELEPLYARVHHAFPHVFDADKNRLYKLFSVLRTFLLVCCLNMFDCYSSVVDTFRAFVSMFTIHNWHIIRDGSLLRLGLTSIDYIILFIGVILLISVSLIGKNGSVRKKIARQCYPVRFVIWYGLFLIIILMGAYGIGYDASQFIYNRF